MANDTLVVVRVNAELRARLQEVATANDRSVAAEVRRTLTRTYINPVHVQR